MNGTYQKIAITISPPDRTGKYNRLEGIYRADKYDLNRKLRLCSKYFILYPETDLQGRLHYHGILKIDDHIKFYKKVLPYIKHSLGFVMLKPLKNHKDNMNWLIYSMKNWPSMRDLFIEPIIITKPKNIKKYNNTQRDLDYGICKYLISTPEDDTIPKGRESRDLTKSAVKR